MKSGSLKKNKSHSCEETQKIAIEFAKSLPPGSVVAFFGDLGAGKTTFIRYLSEHLANAFVNSPTFQYLNIYRGDMTIYHFDLYRLQNASEFLQMGFDEVFDDGGITLIEWAERIEEILPENTISVRIHHAGNDMRHIEIEGL